MKTETPRLSNLQYEYEAGYMGGREVMALLSALQDEVIKLRRAVRVLAAWAEPSKADLKEIEETLGECGI